MTEYQPYGVRHFLREADPEGASELRRRQVATASDGGTLPKGEYRRHRRARSGGALGLPDARPAPFSGAEPAARRLQRSIWRGRYYEVWQRPARTGAGRSADRPRWDGAAGGPPGLRRRARARRRRAPGVRLVAATRPPVIGCRSPARRIHPSGRCRVRPRCRSRAAPASWRRRSRCPTAGRYEVWLGGSVRPHAELRVDGEPAGEVRDQLNNLGQYVRLGEAELGPGTHLIEVRFDGADLHPGSGGTAGAIGPLVLSRADAAEARLVRVRPGSRAAALRSRLGLDRARPGRRMTERSLRAALDRRGRPRPRRLVGRRPRAARDLPRARRLGAAGHLGADRLQPGAGARPRCPAALAGARGRARRG